MIEYSTTGEQQLNLAPPQPVNAADIHTDASVLNLIIM